MSAEVVSTSTEKRLSSRIPGLGVRGWRHHSHARLTLRQIANTLAVAGNALYRLHLKPLSLTAR